MVVHWSCVSKWELNYFKFKLKFFPPCPSQSRVVLICTKNCLAALAILLHWSVWWLCHCKLGCAVLENCEMIHGSDSSRCDSWCCTLLDECVHILWHGNFSKDRGTKKTKTKSHNLEWWFCLFVVACIPLQCKLWMREHMQHDYPSPGTVTKWQEKKRLWMREHIQHNYPSPGIETRWQEQNKSAGGIRPRLYWLEQVNKSL